LRAPRGACILRRGGRERLITIAMSKVIRCPRARVWRALVTPDELIRWDDPKPGCSARWRCRQGSVTVARREDPLEVVVAERLRSAVRLGSFAFEETYTLADRDPEATRLSLRISAQSTLPLLGGELDRFDVRRLSAESVDATLELIQRWCESGRQDAGR